MKIALFVPANPYAGWQAIGGYRNTLEEMGHEVCLSEFPGNVPNNIPRVRTLSPTIEELNAQHVIISGYHEYMQPWLEAVYGKDWSKVRVPVIARFDESMDRTDLGLPQRVEQLKSWATHYSFPAAQDAERFGGQWLPHAADINMFYPQKTEKKYPVAFVGSFYPVREKYLEKLLPHMKQMFFHGPVSVQDLSGCRRELWMQLLAENYRQTGVFFCLPGMSRLLVSKVFEVMACGTFLMYPRLPGNAARNNELFVDGKHLVYYDPGYMADNATQIEYWVEHIDEREAIAAAGAAHVRESFSLTKMLGKLLSLIEQWEATDEKMSAG